MKKFLSVICCLAIILSLAACGGGGGDALKGTWEQEGTDYGTVTWKFDGKGGFTSESDFFDNKTEAGAYLTAGSVVITGREDYFTHTTETRTKIEKSSGSGGTTVDSDGFSGKSGKF